MKQFFYLILFASLFGNLLNPSIGMAKTYTGRIEKAYGRYFILKGSTKLELEVSKLSIELMFQKLKSKDFISLEGQLIAGEQDRKIPRIKITDINYVGLNELLGFWKDQAGYCYYFASFTSMKTFYPNSRLGCSSESIPRINVSHPATYNYFVNPNPDETWNLLLSRGDEQYLAELLRIDSCSLKLTLYNSIDGLLILESLLFRVNP